MGALTKNQCIPIPFDYREAMEKLDSEFTCDICQKTAKLSADPVPFAEACFYYLDAVGDGPVSVVRFCEYLKDNDLKGQSRFILATMTRCNPKMVEANE